MHINQDDTFFKFLTEDTESTLHYISLPRRLLYFSSTGEIGANTW